jgi:hypothetical protein
MSAADRLLRFRNITQSYNFFHQEITTMRSRVMMLALALFLSVTGASAAETAAVNIPFSFVSQGKVFPASQYVVKLALDRGYLTITSKEAPEQRLFLLVGPADISPQASTVNMRFQVVGGSHVLQSVRLGSYQYMR